MRRLLLKIDKLFVKKVMRKSNEKKCENLSYF